MMSHSMLELLIIAIVVAEVTAAVDRECPTLAPGRPRFYDEVSGKCFNCLECEEGEGLSKTCGAGDGKGTVCEPCSGDTFSANYEAKTCGSCRICTNTAEDAVPCTERTDRTCGLCLLGYFHYPDRRDTCHRCEDEKYSDRYDDCLRTGPTEEPKDPSTPTTSSFATTTADGQKPPLGPVPISGIVIAAIIVLVVLIIISVYFIVRKYRQGRTNSDGALPMDTPRSPGDHTRGNSSDVEQPFIPIPSSTERTPENTEIIRLLQLGGHDDGVQEEGNSDQNSNIVQEDSMQGASPFCPPGQQPETSRETSDENQDTQDDPTENLAVDFEPEGDHERQFWGGQGAGDTWGDAQNRPESCHSDDSTDERRLSDQSSVSRCTQTGSSASDLRPGMQPTPDSPRNHDHERYPVANTTSTNNGMTPSAPPEETPTDAYNPHAVINEQQTERQQAEEQKLQRAKELTKDIPLGDMYILDLMLLDSRLHERPELLKTTAKTTYVTLASLFHNCINNHHISSFVNATDVVRFVADHDNSYPNVDWFMQKLHDSGKFVDTLRALVDQIINRYTNGS